MEIRKPETEEERRERVRRSRARKEIQQQRMRRKRLIRLSVYILIGVLAVLLILAVAAIVRKVRSDRADQAVAEAMQEETASAAIFGTEQVLHLSFPVLTLDHVGSGLSVSQFRLILEDLYAAGYVLIDPYMLAGRNEKGFAAAQIMVPEGKKPMVLSQYGVSYTEGDTEHAEALTKDASGRISCFYYDEYGSRVTGAVDVVPLVEEFIESHEDFSYKGARGIIGVTGGSGLLGYQIEERETIEKTVAIERPKEEDEGSESEEDLYGDAQEALLYREEIKHKALLAEAAGADGAEQGGPAGENIPDAGAGNDTAVQAETQDDSDAEKEKAAVAANQETVKDLVSRMRSGGWYIASSTFNGVSYAGSVEMVQEDAQKWNSVLAPLTGTVDMLMLPGGADIGAWSGYSDDNARYAYLRDLGFRYYFVGNNETKTWAQVRPAYVRQVMHEITDYASYLALMNENSETAAESSAEEPDVNVQNTNGTLDLVGEVLQPEPASDVSAEMPEEAAIESEEDTAVESGGDMTEESGVEMTAETGEETTAY